MLEVISLFFMTIHKGTTVAPKGREIYREEQQKNLIKEREKSTLAVLLIVSMKQVTVITRLYEKKIYRFQKSQCL